MANFNFVKGQKLLVTLTSGCQLVDRFVKFCDGMLFLATQTYYHKYIRSVAALGELQKNSK